MNSHKSPLAIVRTAVLVAIPLAFLSAFWIWFLAHRTFSIPSGSMNPTLQIGDYVWASTLSYGLSKYTYPIAIGLGDARFFTALPRRGDVAIFANPRNGDVWIKRVIGLPGDKIQMIKGRLYINGTMVARKAVRDGQLRNGAGRDRAALTYEETLPEGKIHRIREGQADTGFYDDTDVFDVPAGHYFLMGDNRDDSVDSRVPIERSGIGMVPFENFIARADMVLFSTKDLGRVLRHLD